MKASFSPGAAMALAVFAAVAHQAAADTLILTNGQRREGEILGVADNRVRFKTGPVETALPLAQVEAARMEPPQKFQEALDAWQSGDAAKTLPLLKPLVENFNGLPAPWVRRASALLGTVLVESGDIPAAKAAFADFSKTYPDAQGLADLGLARLAIAEEDFDTASGKLEPLVNEAKETLVAESTKSAEFGQALYLYGIILEKRGEAPSAIEHYLLASTIFYADGAAAAKAKSRAAELAAEKNAAVP